MGNLHLSQHLADDNSDMLVVDPYINLLIYLENFVHQVGLESILSKDIQYVVRILLAVAQLLAGLYLIAIPDKQVLAHRDKMLELSLLLIGYDDNSLALALSAELDSSGNHCKNCRILRNSGLEQFLDTWKTFGDIRTLGNFLIHLGQHYSGLDICTVFYRHIGVSRQIVGYYLFAFLIYDGDSRIQGLIGEFYDSLLFLAAVCVDNLSHGLFRLKVMILDST